MQAGGTARAAAARSETPEALKWQGGGFAAPPLGARAVRRPQASAMKATQVGHPVANAAGDGRSQSAGEASTSPSACRTDPDTAATVATGPTPSQPAMSTNTA